MKNGTTSSSSIATAISLLREKNVCLEKFYVVNENELINLASNDFENLEAFYGAREQILSLIRKIDAEVESVCVQPGLVVSQADRATVRELLAAKDELVSQIIDQDVQVLDYIDREKNSMIRELRAANQARRAVGAYASAERRHLLDEK